MALTSSADITIAPGSIMSAVITLSVLPPANAPYGFGKLIHPILGAFDYQYKPDEWVNVDSDVIIRPDWANTKTLTSGVNALWAGNIKDVVAEERWVQALTMPVAQLRMMIAVYTTPVDPALGYVQWAPNYSNNFIYNVIPIKLTVGDSDDIVLDDFVNLKDDADQPDGFVVRPVTFTMRLVSRVN
jgi:hypothetical protein